MSWAAEEIQALYTLDLRPKITIRPSSALGLYYERPYREYRIVRVRVPSSTQLSLALEDE